MTTSYQPLDFNVIKGLCVFQFSRIEAVFHRPVFARIMHKNHGGSLDQASAHAPDA